jgi:predicted RNase H-like HicB family nuclease
MAIHDEVLRAAVRICRERARWMFTPQEIVRALPHRPASSVRTHVTSRCCVNAPANHESRLDYFRRVKRGVYEVLPRYRRAADAGQAARVQETRPAYAAARRPLRDAVHVVITRDDQVYVAECLELAVVTQGHTLDETVSNLREAVGVHLEGEDPAEFGLTASPRLVITHETATARVP